MTGFETEGTVLTLLDLLESTELLTPTLYVFVSILNLSGAFTLVMNALAFERLTSLVEKNRVKHRDNPWFSAALYDLIKERDVAWAKARQTHLDSDWLHFRQLRNKCTVANRKSKSDYFLDKTEVNLTNPRKLWKNVDVTYKMAARSNAAAAPGPKDGAFMSFNPKGTAVSLAIPTRFF